MYGLSEIRLSTGMVQQWSVVTSQVMIRAVCSGFESYCKKCWFPQRINWFVTLIIKLWRIRFSNGPNHLHFASEIILGGTAESANGCNVKSECNINLMTQRSLFRTPFRKFQGFKFRSKLKAAWPSGYRFTESMNRVELVISTWGLDPQTYCSKCNLKTVLRTYWESIMCHIGSNV